MWIQISSNEQNMNIVFAVKLVGSASGCKRFNPQIFIIIFFFLLLWFEFHTCCWSLFSSNLILSLHLIISLCDQKSLRVSDWSFESWDCDCGWTESAWCALLVTLLDTTHCESLTVKSIMNPSLSSPLWSFTFSYQQRLVTGNVYSVVS